MSGSATELPVATLRLLGSVPAEVVETLDWLIKAWAKGERAHFYSKGGRLTKRGWDLRDYRPKLIENVGDTRHIAVTELGWRVLDFRCKSAKKKVRK